MTPEKLKWILADAGHGREWAHVFRIGDEDAERLWNAIAQAALDAQVFRVIDRGNHGTACGVAFPLTLNGRTATVTTSWHHPAAGDAPRLVTAYPTSSMDPMPALRDIATSYLVELTTPVEGVPAGARGGVLELRDDNTAMIEITSLPLDSVERIIFVPLAQLRRIG
ncbi:MAG: DUF6883 domain-containing protein [Solirubrobacteraceae bacterium]|jgi:hypothetical protein